MPVETFCNNEYFVIKVGKKFGWRESAQIIMATEDGRQKGFIHMVFDLTDCTHLDSAGVGSVMDTYRRLDPIGGTVSVFNPNQNIQNILSVAKIDTMIRVYFAKPTEGSLPLPG